jgi:preprotein translocase subunit SecA
MRIFGSERMDGMLQKLGLKEGEAIIHPWINKALEKAQEKVEARNYEIRKHLLRFDDVMNDQRKVVYQQRREIMSAPDVAAMIVDMRHETIERIVARYLPENSLPDQWDTGGLHAEVGRLLNLDLPLVDWAKEEGIAEDNIRERITEAADAKMAQKAATYGPELMRLAERSLLLQILDQTWKEHLLALDHLRQGINLRAYAQRDPLNEYKHEAFVLFQEMLNHLREAVTSVLSHVELRVQQAADQSPPPSQPMPPPPRPRMIETHEDPAWAGGGLSPDGDAALAVAPPPAAQAAASPWAKTPRNAPCPCGSGKKFKHCHGRV